MDLIDVLHAVRTAPAFENAAVQVYNWNTKQYEEVTGVQVYSGGKIIRLISDIEDE